MTKTITYYPNGQQKEEYEIINHKFPVAYKQWTEQGKKIMQINYSDGVRDGEHFLFDISKNKIVVWEYYVFGNVRWNIFNNTKSYLSLKHLITNKKRNLIKKKIKNTKNEIYKLNNDYAIYYIILDYLTWDEKANLVYGKLIK
jgi:antitoxin component YwqK of YwqJK toxin-antitoxin module